MSIHLSKGEVKSILSGLDIERDRLRIELSGEHESAYESGEYQQLVNLQDKLIAYLESIPY